MFGSLELSLLSPLGCLSIVETEPGNISKRQVFAARFAVLARRSPAPGSFSLGNYSGSDATTISGEKAGEKRKNDEREKKANRSDPKKRRWPPPLKLKSHARLKREAR